jgi:hypothetical protein
MNYKELTYKEKMAFEATLKPSQKAKIRKMKKETEEQIQPINWARNAREQEVRKEAWTSLKCGERIATLENAHAPKLHALGNQLQAIQEELSKAREELAEERSKIQTEPYRLIDLDPEVKAMQAILRKMREAQEVKIQNLVDSFQEKVSN